MRFLALCLPGARTIHHGLENEAASLNWAVLLDLARLHGMMPLVAQKLLAPGSKKQSGFAPPDSALATLRAYQQQHLFRSLTLTGALVELQRECTRAGLRIIPWKGPSVGLLLYGSPTLRESADLDFLFLEKDLPQVLAVTERLGYQLLGNRDSLSKLLYVLALQREFTFGRSSDRVPLEFHLQVLPSRYTLWQDSQTDIHRANTRLPFADVEFLLQSPEDLLVSLCAHATKHNWDRMKWSGDIAQFLGVYSSQVDWEPFFARLVREKKDCVVLLGLALSSELFAVELPPAALRSMERYRHLTSLAQDLARHILSGSTSLLAPRQRKAIISLLSPRLRDRVAYQMRPMLELNYEDLYIPVQNRAFFFLNYGLRFFRLLRKYGLQRLASKTADSVRSVR